jgi:alpha-D-ribose 1-methylphosphonate 5-triphosphate synthase subunit PhnH
MLTVGPVEPAQAIFRRLVEAMSYPGRLVQIAPPAEPTVAALALAVAETLLDHEVRFGVVTSNTSDQLTEAIFALTKAKRATLEQADYVFVDGADSHGAVNKAQRGRGDYPDQGATLIYLLPEEPAQKKNAPDRGIMLQGPGIEHGIVPQMPGLSRTEMVLLRQANDQFPLGVDAIFLQAPDRIMCIPRSSRITVVV